jgi:hypothetical protein
MTGFRLGLAGGTPLVTSTLQLLDQYPQPIELLATAWLKPLRPSGAAYRAEDSLPFTLITRIGGNDDLWRQLDDPVISVHTLTDKTLGYRNLFIETQNTHRRMLRLGLFLDDIVLSDGSVAAVDYVKIFQAPLEVRFEDVMVLRMVARYQIGLSYISSSS